MGISTKVKAYFEEIFRASLSGRKPHKIRVLELTMITGNWNGDY